VGWAEEISLDLDMASAICPSCNILLVEASSASIANLGAAVNRAAAMGANVISNSYGGGESSSDPSTTNQFYNHPGVLITVSSGDSGSASSTRPRPPPVLAVGGTHLVRNSSSRGWTETVWGSANNANGGAGSGCSRFEDQAELADRHRLRAADRGRRGGRRRPADGVAVLRHLRRRGRLAGLRRTSVAAPVVASIFALTGHASATPQYPYANLSQFFDVVAASTAPAAPATSAPAWSATTAPPVSAHRTARP